MTKFFKIIKNPNFGAFWAHFTHFQTNKNVYQKSTLTSFFQFWSRINVQNFRKKNKWADSEIQRFQTDGRTTKWYYILWFSVIWFIFIAKNVRKFKKKLWKLIFFFLNFISFERDKIKAQGVCEFDFLVALIRKWPAHNSYIHFCDYIQWKKYKKDLFDFNYLQLYYYMQHTACLCPFDEM